MALLTQDRKVTGTLGAAQAKVTVNSAGLAVVTFQFPAGLVGTVTFEATNDDAASPTLVSIPATNVATGTRATTAANPSGIYRVDASGLRTVQARVSAYTSGSVAVIANGSFAPFADPSGVTGGGGSSGGAVAGDVAHDAVDSGNPVKIGMRAVAHGANPTGVAAGDRTDSFANVAGIPFHIGGHPNIITRRDTFSTAQTDTKLITVAGGTKIVVTRIAFTCDKANTLNILARAGFAATNTPTGAGVLISHPGIDPGGGISQGNGAGILGVGADGDDLILTTVNAGNIDVVTSYYTIEV